MNDLTSSPRASVDSQNAAAARDSASKGGDAVDSPGTSAGASSGASPSRPRTAGRKRWFGGDERQSVAFYGDFYR